MHEAAAENRLRRLLIEIRQKQDQKGQVVGERHLAGEAVLFFQYMAEAAVIAAVEVKFLEFQFRFIDEDIAEHSAFSLSCFCPRSKDMTGRSYGIYLKAACILLL